MDSKPENVMAFPRLKSEFKKHIEDEELGKEGQGKITRIMKLQ